MRKPTTNTSTARRRNKPPPWPCDDAAALGGTGHAHAWPVVRPPTTRLLFPVPHARQPLLARRAHERCLGSRAPASAPQVALPLIPAPGRVHEPPTHKVTKRLPCGTGLGTSPHPCSYGDPPEGAPLTQKGLPPPLQLPRSGKERATELRAVVHENRSDFPNKARRSVAIHAGSPRISKPGN